MNKIDKCHQCGGKFKIEFITTDPDKTQIMSDGSMDSFEEYIELKNKIKSEGIKGVQIRLHPETQHWYICKVILFFATFIRQPSNRAQIAM